MWTDIDNLQRLAKLAPFIFIVIGFLVALFGQFAKTKLDDRVRQLQKERQDARASAAELKLEYLRRQVAPRQVQREVFLREIAGQPKAHVTITYVRDDPECFDVAQQIWRLLQDAKWDVVPPVAIPASNTGDPTAMSVDGQPSGVTVVANSVSTEEASALNNVMDGKPWVKTPYTVLSNALMQSIGEVKGHAGGPNRPVNGTLRVVVAPR